MEKSLSNGRTIPVSMIGYGTMESIPVFHYMPGGIAARVVIQGYENPFYECKPFPICIFGGGRVALEAYPVPIPRVIDRARAWRVESVFIDGLEPLILRESRILAETAREAGFIVGARTMGGVDGSILGLLDYVVIDYIAYYALDPSISVDTINLLSSIGDDVWVEVSVYIPKPDIEYLLPVVEVTGPDTPLHVHVEDHGGGGPVKKLYEELTRKYKFVYIHNDLYYYLDTQCPRCGAPVASRSHGFLRALEAEGGRCWKCGEPLPLHRIARKKSPRRIWLINAEEGVAWYPVANLAVR